MLKLKTFLYCCLDLDECDLGTASCGDDTTCVNTIGSYQCPCESGKIDLDPKSGVDIEWRYQFSDIQNTNRHSFLNL